MGEKKFKLEPQIIYKKNPKKLQLVNSDEQNQRVELFKTNTKDLLEKAYSLIVNYPEELFISVTQGPKTIIFNIECHPDDFGNILGKNGQIIQSLRNLVKRIASKNKVRAIINIDE